MYEKLQTSKKNKNSPVRILYLFFVVCFWTADAYSQRHLLCDNAIEILAGATRYGYAVQPAFVRYFSPQFYAKAGIFYSQELDSTLFHYVMGLDVMGGYTIYNPSRNFYLSALAGAGFSSEKGRWREADFYDYYQTKWSVLVGFEGEFYLNNRWSAALRVDQHIVTDFKDSWGFRRWYAMAGLRFHFYRLHRCNPASTHRVKRVMNGGL